MISFFIAAHAKDEATRAELERIVEADKAHVEVIKYGVLIVKEFGKVVYTAPVHQALAEGRVEDVTRAWQQ